MTVEPSTTCEFSDNPLYAATVRVVRLLAAAIDHSVSPGCTTCGTAALEGAARRSAKSTAYRGVRRKAMASCSRSDSTRLAPRRALAKRHARGYVALHAILRVCVAGDRRAKSSSVGAEVALVRAQLPAVAPGAHSLRVRQAPQLRPLAGARPDPRDVRREPAHARRARPARAQRLADGPRPDPHR